MIYALLVLFYFGLPWLIILLTLKSEFAHKIGAVVIAYTIGLIVGNIGIIPEKYGSFIDFLTMFSVAVAIPLILFSTNLKLWFKIIGKTFLSVILGLLAVIIAVVTGFFIFRSYIDKAWQIAGLLVGLYSGGDPNLASLKTALNVSQERFVLVHVSDIFFSAIFLIFIITYGKKFFELFLPKFKLTKEQQIAYDEKDVREFHDFFNFFKRKNIPDLVIGFILSLLIVGISSLIGDLSETFFTTLIILSITTLALAASFIPKVRNLKKTFQLGLYFIIVFSLLVASRAYFKDILQIKSLYIFLYVIYAVISSILIHTILAKIFKLDADTMIISSIALVYSVPFVPVVATALKNKHLILSGIIVGLFGYVIGNYLGIMLAYILR